MEGRRKRLREPTPPAAAAASPKAAQDPIETSMQVAKTLGSVGTGVWEALRQELDEAAKATASHRAVVRKLSTDLLQRSVEQCQAELTCVSLSRDLQRHAREEQHLSQLLEASAATAASAVLSHVDEAVRCSMADLQSQLEDERTEKMALAAKVHALATSTSATLKDTNEQLLHARLEVEKSRIAYARLQAKYTAAEACHRGTAERVQILMELAAELAKKSRNVAATEKELSRCQLHLQHLERAVGLKGVVDAFASPAASPLCSDGPASSDTARGATPRPAEELLRRGAPEYAAFVALRAEKLSLSELVQAWRTQAQRQREAEVREAALKQTFEELRDQASLVHHRFLEERQRREMLERRLAEAERQRLCPDANAALVEALNRLRAAYDEVLNERAELKFSLSKAESELCAATCLLRRKEDEENKRNQTKEEDHVERRLEHLEACHQRSIKYLKDEVEELESRCLLLMYHRDQSAELVQTCHSALEAAQERVEQLTAAVQQTSSLRLDTHGGANATVTDLVAQAKAGVQQLQGVLSQAAERTSRVVQQQQTQETSAAARDMQMASTGLQEVLSECTRLTAAASTKQQAMQTLQSLTASLEQRVSGSMDVMERIVQEALQFVVRHLSKTDSEKAVLHDRAVEDAQRVAALTDALQSLSAERESLRSQLQEATKLIDMNHLCILEHARMQEITVEDSLEAAEATLQLSHLREELNARQLALSTAQEQLAAAISREENLSLALQREQLGKQLLESDVARLEGALATSQREASNAVQRYVEVEGRLTALVRGLEEDTRHPRPAAGEPQRGESAAPTTNAPEGSAGYSLAEIQQRFTVELQRVADGVQAALKQAADASTEEHQKESDLLYKGYAHVVTALRDACQRLGLLERAGTELKERTRSHLLEVAMDGNYVDRSAREALERKNAECQQLQNQLAMGQERQQRLLGLCKSLQEKLFKAQEEATAARAAAEAQAQAQAPALVYPPAQMQPSIVSGVLTTAPTATMPTSTAPSATPYATHQQATPMASVPAAPPNAVGMGTATTSAPDAAASATICPAEPAANAEPPAAAPTPPTTATSIPSPLPARTAPFSTAAPLLAPLPVATTATPLEEQATKNRGDRVQDPPTTTDHYGSSGDNDAAEQGTEEKAEETEEELLASNTILPPSSPSPALQATTLPSSATEDDNEERHSRERAPPPSAPLEQQQQPEDLSEEEKEEEEAAAALKSSNSTPSKVPNAAPHTKEEEHE